MYFIEMILLILYYATVQFTLKRIKKLSFQSILRGNAY